MKDRLSDFGILRLITVVFIFSRSFQRVEVVRWLVIYGRIFSLICVETPEGSHNWKQFVKCRVPVSVFPFTSKLLSPGQNQITLPSRWWSFVEDPLTAGSRASIFLMATITKSPAAVGPGINEAPLSWLNGPINLYATSIFRSNQWIQLSTGSSIRRSVIYLQISSLADRRTNSIKVSKSRAIRIGTHGRELCRVSWPWPNVASKGKGVRLETPPPLECKFPYAKPWQQQATRTQRVRERPR